jgi:hypothetical protein
MFKKWTFAIGLLLIAGLSAFYLFNGVEEHPAQAGSGDNVKGFAWSSNIGWISFNSYNCDQPTENGTTESNLVFPNCPAGQTVVDYGVHIDLITGEVRGEAWSSNLGWIDFSLTNAEAASAPDDPKVPARYNPATQELEGWAKATTLGNDGWIKMSTDDTTSPWHGHGARIDGEELRGWVWNGNGALNSGIGWISLNCLDDPLATVCNYAVTIDIPNNPPTATDINVSQVGDPCAEGQHVRQFALRWIFDDPDAGDEQSQYKIRLVKLETGGETQVWEITCSETDYLNGLAECQTNPVGTGNFNYMLNCSNLDCTSGEFQYDTRYKIFLEVFDAEGLSSGEIEMVDASDTDGDGYENTFTTASHEYPEPYITMSNLDPSALENVRLDALDPIKPTIWHDSGNVTARQFLWSSPDPDVNIISPGDSLTDAVFQQVGDRNVTLEVWDDAGYNCATSTMVQVRQRLPNWEER